MPLLSSLLGLSETELCEMIYSLVPDWRGDALEDFDFLSGGYSNANVVFTIEATERSALCAAHSVRAQPYVNRALNRHGTNAYLVRGRAPDCFGCSHGLNGYRMGGR